MSRQKSSCIIWVIRQNGHIKQFGYVDWRNSYPKPVDTWHHKKLRPMNTQTHVLIASALFSKSGTSSTARNISAAGGGLLPDLAIFFMFFWSKVIGTPEHTVWNEWYFNSKWQFVINISNCLPLFITLLLIGSAIARWYKKKVRYSLLLIIFSFAAIIPSCGDINPYDESKSSAC
ncbi:MAG: hypothetical protein GY761_06265 [Hyphomicrobiales bacterium]|nr:hypothetical protein [Hyphomicrobiales bacterium]